MNIITYPEVKQLIKNRKSIFLIDIREYEEYKERHMDNAINIPEETIAGMIDAEDEMFKEIVCMYRKGCNIILYCSRGNKSMIIAEKMHLHKVEAFSLYGGMDEYDRYVKYEKSV